MSRKYERNDKIALLYPANLLAAQTYFQLSFVFVQLRVVFGGRNSVTFRWDTCFRPICRTVLPNLVRIIRLISKQIFHPKLIPFDNFVSFFGVVHLSACQAKIKWHFFYICDHVYFSSQASHAPANLPVFTIATHACGGSMCLNGRRINHGNIAFTCFAASDVKTSRKAPLLLQRAKRLRIVSNFPYFSGISLHDRPSFVTQLAQLMTTRAQIFQRCWGLAKIFKPVKLLFEIRGISIPISS